MAKKPLQLGFVDIVMGAQADVIKEAYEARVKIDDLLDVREEAYRKIAELEVQVEDIVGVEGEFVFPAPPMAVAGINKPNDASRPKPPKKVVAKSVDGEPEVLSDEVEETGEESVGLPEPMDLDDLDDVGEDAVLSEDSADDEVEDSDDEDKADA